jgi:hypothetical protein
MFTLRNVDLNYWPYPHGVAAPLLPDPQYRQLVAGFPETGLFGRNRINVKYVLSERVNRRQYYRFLRSTPDWMRFYRWVKSDRFIQGVLDELKSRHVDLGYRQRPALPRLARRLAYGLSGRRDYHTSLVSRFEFSMLPADGGSVIPHTDAPGKVVTLILPMLAEGDWDPGLGGATVINTPREDRLRFNGVNGKADFGDMEIASSLAFEPNRALVFVRTYDSWHSVRPMTATGSPVMRKTVTVSILER